jgi:hypothetical protein
MHVDLMNNKWKSGIYFMLQNIVPNVVIHNYFQNAFYSDMIEISPLVPRTYHLIVSYKLAIFNV